MNTNTPDKTSTQWPLILLLLGALLATVGSSAWAQDRMSGVSEGILTAKGDAWIAVRPDNANQPVKLIPRWIGGLPKNGGGLDKRMLLLFRELQPGMRLKVSWLQDEHLRVVDLQILPPQKEGEQGKSGVAVGTVKAKGETWISVLADGEQEPQKLIPRWIGGSPEGGGGFDRQMLQTIAATPVGARVQLEWAYEEHLRVISLQRVE